MLDKLNKFTLLDHPALKKGRRLTVRTLPIISIRAISFRSNLNA